MTLNIKNIIKKNIRFISAMIVVIILGIFGISYALKVAPFNKIAVNIKSANMDVNISYDSGVNGADISNSGNLLPINDSLVTGPTVSDSRVLKAKFYVTGNTSNPENSIYDVAIHDFNVDCELRTEDLKWRLYKNGTLLSSGNLSPKFDTMSNNRLVLTETQQDLTTTKDEYVFLLWISESCSGDIANCSKEQDQSKYLGKSLSGSIKVELATKSKKALVRTTGVSGSCNYTMTSTPTCNTLTYNGNEQTLVSAGDNYTISNGTGTNAGDYAVTLKLKDGYKWNDGSTNDKILNCSINRKSASISASNQTIKYGSSIDNSKYSVSNLISGHSVSSVYLDTNIDKVGTGVITPTKSKIVDTSGNDVTDNYDLNYISGTLTINCLNTAVPPTAGNKRYNGSEQIGVSGGSNIDLTGTLKATAIGNYNASAVPKANYCWNDGTTTKRDYVWSIKSNTMYITLNNKEADYTGSAINIDTPVIKNSDGDIITGPTLTYAYYNGGSCSGTALSGAPSNAGSYSVRATANAYGEYARSDSNCATLVINKVDSTLYASIPESITYGRTATLTYTLNPTGNVTCSSSNAHVATCSVDTTNKKITITPVNVGNTQITINGIPSNSNYNSSSVSKNVVINCSNTATEPSVVSGLIYNGSSQTGLKGGSNVNLSTISAINAGNYTGKATPKTNYCWTDGTTTTKSYSWSIAKKDVRCSITSVPTLKYPSSATGSIKYSCTDSKVPSVTSSSTSDITVSGVTSTSATLKALKVGSSIITISTASDTNYNASNKATTNISISGDTYTISYNANNGTGAPASQSKSYGVGIKLSTSIPTRTGYTFTGWNTASDGSGTAYASGADFTNNANTVLYAQWRINKVYVGFNTNGGSITKNTDVYVADSNGNIAKNGSYKFHSISYGGTLGTSGLTNYNNTKYLYVEKTGSAVTSGQEWICMSGCTQANKVFNQTDQYAASDFCDASKSDCSVVLGVNWNDRYTVTYNNNGGSGCSSKTVTPGGIYGTMCVPTREGYTFVGWFDSGYKDSPLNYYADTYSDLKNVFGTNQDALYNHYLEYGKNEGRRISQYIASDKFTANANQTIYAGWKAGYLIEYNANGGSGTMNSTLATTGSSVTIKSNGFTRDGYLFEGWTTNSNGTDDGYGWTGWSGTWNYTSGKYGIANSKLVLYARWKTIKTYTISYNSNGGSGTMSSDTVSTGGAATIKNNTFTRSGYTFAGWTTNSDGTDDGYGWAEGWSGIWNYDNGQYGIANNALVLYARWNPKSYTINYNANGGSGTMSSSTVSSGSSVTIKNNTFTKKGYTFAGWTTNSNGTDDGYGWTAGKSYTWNYDNGQKGISNNTLKLYARWTANSYTISYNSNGGSGTMSSSTVSTGGSVTIKSNTFTRTGYKFVGWTTNSNGTDDGYGWTAGKSYTWKYDNGQLGVTNNSLVLYARWDNHFTVTYNDNGGRGCSGSSKTVTYGSTYGNLCTPTRSGYIFAGWYSSNYANAPWTYYYDKYKNNSTVASIGRNDKVGLYNNYLTNSTRKFSRYTSSDTYSVNGNQTLVAGWLKFNYKRTKKSGASCDEGYFDTISDAHSNCYGITINLLDDVTESSGYTFTGYGPSGYTDDFSITIALNNHTLTIPSLIFDASTGDTAHIEGPGKITYSSSQTNISDNSALIHVKNGNLYINGGSYISNDLNSAIRVESGAKLNLDDSNSRLAIEATVINSAYTACTTGIKSYDTDEWHIRSSVNGMYIYACTGISYPGVLRVASSYPTNDSTGIEMSVIGYLGYGIMKITGNIQVGSPVCATRDNCTADEIKDGCLGHYGYGYEMYPYIASYSATTNNELFSAIYNNSDVVIWYTGGRLVSTKTGLSCANGGIYSNSDACYRYFSIYPITKPSIYTNLKYSLVSNEKNSHGDNINGFKVMAYK